jgi:hypothetical protein
LGDCNAGARSAGDGMSGGESEAVSVPFAGGGAGMQEQSSLAWVGSGRLRVVRTANDGWSQSEVSPSQEAQARRICTTGGILDLSHSLNTARREMRDTRGAGGRAMEEQGNFVTLRPGVFGDAPP